MDSSKIIKKLKEAVGEMESPLESPFRSFEPILVGNPRAKAIEFMNIAQQAYKRLNLEVKENKNLEVKEELRDLSETVALRKILEKEIAHCEIIRKSFTLDIEEVGVRTPDGRIWHYTDIKDKIRDLKTAKRLLKEVEGIHFELIKRYLEPSKKHMEELAKLKGEKKRLKERIRVRLKRKEKPFYV